MGHRRFDYRLLGLLLALVPTQAGAAELTTQQAASHIGETATVCGIVVSANHSVRTKGQPTFLNLDQPYPKHVFTVLIWGSDRGKFGTPEVQWMGKRLCATGKIDAYKAGLRSWRPIQGSSLTSQP